MRHQLCVSVHRLYHVLQHAGRIMCRSAPWMANSRPAALGGLPTSALAKRKAYMSMGPLGGTPTFQSFTRPGQSWVAALTHLNRPESY